MPTEDDDLEEEGLPQLFDPPPGQDIETDQTAPVVPRDRPMGVNQWGVTEAEERQNVPVLGLKHHDRDSRSGEDRQPPEVWDRLGVSFARAGAIHDPKAQRQ